MWHGCMAHAPLLSLLAIPICAHAISRSGAKSVALDTSYRHFKPRPQGIDGTHYSDVQATAMAKSEELLRFNDAVTL